MEPLPMDLLSTALYVLWDYGHSEDPRAVELIAQRKPGFSAQQYAEASRLAAELNRTAYDLAVPWFASKGDPSLYPTAAGLEERCPGFSRDNYVKAIDNNILWARL